MENDAPDIVISEKCAFCEESFNTLNTFVEHLAKSCKVKDLEEKSGPLNVRQRKTIERKDEWCKHSNKKLNQQLDNNKGTRAGERSIAGDYSSVSGASFVSSCAFGHPEGLVPDRSFNRWGIVTIRFVPAYYLALFRKWLNISSDPGG